MKIIVLRFLLLLLIFVLTFENRSSFIKFQIIFCGNGFDVADALNHIGGVMVSLLASSAVDHCGVMVSLLASSAVDHWFEPR